MSASWVNGTPSAGSAWDVNFFDENTENASFEDNIYEVKMHTKEYPHGIHVQPTSKNERLKKIAYIAAVILSAIAWGCAVAGIVLAFTVGVWALIPVGIGMGSCIAMLAARAIHNKL